MAILLTLASIFYLSFSAATSYYDSKAAKISDPIAQQDYKDSVRYLKLPFGINDGYTYLEKSPVFALAPGTAVILLVLAFNIFGDGLRDALDPRMRGRR